MINSIQQAMEKTNAVSAVPRPPAASVAAVNSVIVHDEDDPEIIKKKLEAKKQKEKAEKERMLAELKQNASEKAKSELKKYALSKLPAIPAALTDPKLLAAVGVLRELKKNEKNQQDAARKNLEKNEEAYTYPLKSSAMEKIPPVSIPFKI